MSTEYFVSKNTLTLSGGATLRLVLTYEIHYWEGNTHRASFSVPDNVNKDWYTEKVLQQHIVEGVTGFEKVSEEWKMGY